MKQVHPEMLKSLRSYYPPGTRVELVRMDAPYTKLKPCDRGTVSFIDYTGTYEKLSDMKSCYTDTAPCLLTGTQVAGWGVVFSEDEIKKLEE